MKRLYCEISIGRFRFDYVTSLTIESSRETFTDTARIEMPNKIKDRAVGELRYITDYIKVNDAVTIKLGYFPNLATRFTGYVAKIIPGSPLVVQCEDEAFQLKQKTVGPFSAQGITLSSLISSLYDGPADVTDANIGDIRIGSNATMANVLDDLKQRFGIRSYFRDGRLKVFQEVTETGDDIALGFQLNIIDHSLEYQDSDALDIISHGISLQDDGTKIERYVKYNADGTIGRPSSDNPGGTLNTFKWPGLSQAALDELITRRLPRLYYSGITGNLTAFGEPVIQHGDNVVLTDKYYEERKGTYKVKAVRTEFGTGGYRQTVELDLKVA